MPTGVDNTPHVVAEHTDGYHLLGRCLCQITLSSVKQTDDWVSLWSCNVLLFSDTRSPTYLGKGEDGATCHEHIDHDDSCPCHDTSSVAQHNHPHQRQQDAAHQTCKGTCRCDKFCTSTFNIYAAVHVLYSSALATTACQTWVRKRCTVCILVDVGEVECTAKTIHSNRQPV